MHSGPREGYKCEVRKQLVPRDEREAALRLWKALCAKGRRFAPRGSPFGAGDSLRENTKIASYIVLLGKMQCRSVSIVL